MGATFEEMSFGHSPERNPLTIEPRASATVQADGRMQMEASSSRSKRDKQEGRNKEQGRMVLSK